MREERKNGEVLYVEVQIQAGARDMEPYWHSIEESIKKRSSIRSGIPTRKEVSDPVETAWNVGKVQITIQGHLRITPATDMLGKDL
jgi:hypothetical protein